MVLLPQTARGGLQHAVALGLAAASGADKHDAKAHIECLVQLHHLCVQGVA